MNKTRLILLAVILGCVFAQSFANPIEKRQVRKRSIDDGEAEEVEAKPKGKKKGKSPSGNGTAEAIRADPENTQRYKEYNAKNFEGVQGIIDKHFEKKKKEGDEISAQGERAQKEAAGTQKRFEKGHYDDMEKGFKYADKSMTQAVSDFHNSNERDTDAGGEKRKPKGPPKGGMIGKNKPSDRRNAKGKADKPKPKPEPEPEPEVEAEDGMEEPSEYEGGMGNGPIDESDEEI